MTRVGFKEALLLPVNVGGAALALFGLFKASQGERAPLVFPLIILCLGITLWISRTTRIVRTKQAIAAGALLLASTMIAAVLALNGYGSR